MPWASSRSIQQSADALKSVFYRAPQVLPPKAQALVFAATRHHVTLLKALLEADNVAADCVYGTMDMTARKIALARHGPRPRLMCFFLFAATHAEPRMLLHADRTDSLSPVVCTCCSEGIVTHVDSQTLDCPRPQLPRAQDPRAGRHRRGRSWPGPSRP